MLLEIDFTQKWVRLKLINTDSADRELSWNENSLDKIEVGLDMIKWFTIDMLKKYKEKR